MFKSAFKSRQAPSPTGYLHLGFVRTTLYTVLLARNNQGSWFLRCDDTDRTRLLPDAYKPLVEGLYELGLIPDEGVGLEPNGPQDDFYHLYQKGEYGPYIQSERLEIYQEHCQAMLDRRLAYFDYLSAADKEELQELKKATNRPIDYFKINLERFGEEKVFASLKDGLAHQADSVLRYRLQRSGVLVCADLLLGEIRFDLSLEEDFVILKKDGYPTYHLAHIIDDHLMQTTHVIRAQEWTPSLPKHVVMFEEYWGGYSQGSEKLDLKLDLNKPVFAPKFIHIPVILPVEGNKKMSKRDGNVNMAKYFKAGYLPEAVINYLAFLGWNPGTDQELYLSAKDFA